VKNGGPTDQWRRGISGERWMCRTKFADRYEKLKKLHRQNGTNQKLLPLNSNDVTAFALREPR